MMNDYSHLVLLLLLARQKIALLHASAEIDCFLFFYGCLGSHSQYEKMTTIVSSLCDN